MRSPTRIGPLQPGSELGAYRIVAEIGAGGMGRVYLGERADGLFERRVAIKVVHLDHAHTDLGRLLREQQILAELVHPHIAQLYDAGLTADGSPYIVMEHVAGEAIDDYCRRRGSTRGAACASWWMSAPRWRRRISA